jgi:hypothetical protein
MLNDLCNGVHTPRKCRQGQHGVYIHAQLSQGAAIKYGYKTVHPCYFVQELHKKNASECHSNEIVLH